MAKPPQSIVHKLLALVKMGHILRLEKVLISYEIQALSDSSPLLTHLQCWEQQLAILLVGFARIRRVLGCSDLVDLVLVRFFLQH
jgi:hypothetical protein